MKHQGFSQTEQQIVGDSQAMAELRSLISFAATARSNVLITGESGTGKELVAHALHSQSQRAPRPFVALNSGAIPRELIESELFGHEKGSFTSATSRRIGHFERADQGSLFLDEIGEMPADLQVRLLRVLEERKIRRVGGHEDIDVDVRLIAATHQSMEEALENGHFRDDLYYRLAVLPIHLPPLRERREDIPALVNHFLSRGFASDAPPNFTRLAIDIMCDYDWPGNVRELRNLVERAAVFFPASDIGRKELEILMRPGLSRRKQSTASTHKPSTGNDNDHDDRGSRAAASGGEIWNRPAHLPNGQGDQAFHLREHLQNEEKRVLVAALERSGGVVASAAKMVNLRRTTFLEKMKRYQIERSAAMN